MMNLSGPTSISDLNVTIGSAPTVGATLEHRKASPLLSIVVPCYNEEEVLPETIARLKVLLDQMVIDGHVSDGSHVICVDDGSRDRTWQLIKEFSLTDSRVKGVKLSGNRGHQAALIAGLFAAQGDAIVSVDADLQDDINAIRDMVIAFSEGADVVYGVRKKRTTDTIFKRKSALWYYSMLQNMGVKIVHNHADFRLLSRRAIESLKQYPEVNLFLRGIVPLIGYKSKSVFYDRAERFAGESKYPLKKMLAFAIDGVTSFSAVPLRLISLIGFLVSLASLAMVVWVVWVKFFNSQAVPGWASSVIPIYFLGGIQLLSIGVLGEYIAKLYFEAKRRPRYFIDETV
jgi:polyisoprenyl-phosphate glycosyltransferase